MNIEKGLSEIELLPHYLIHMNKKWEFESHLSCLIDKKVALPPVIFKRNGQILQRVIQF